MIMEKALVRCAHLLMIIAIALMALHELGPWLDEYEMYHAAMIILGIAAGIVLSGEWSR